MVRRAPRIAIVAFPGFQPLDVVGPFDAFTGAARAGAAYDVVVAAPRRGVVRGDNGLALVAHTSLAALARAPVDTLLVAGGAGTRAAGDDPAVVRAVAAAARRARRVASVCTGSFLLAAAGLLDRKRATTHWAYCDALARRFPRVTVEADPIYVRDGRVWTSAGVTAGIDLALALIEADHGRDLALLVARWLVVFVRRAGGQSQFSPPLAAQAAASSPLRDLQAFIVEQPAADLSVPALAGRAHMSVRHFGRVFRETTGATPAAFVERVRVDAARRMLEDHRGRAIDDIAAAAGFGSPDALRRAFARGVGLNPREYRARFAAGS